MSALHALRNLAYLARTRLQSKDHLQREEAGFGLLQQVARWISPDYVLTEFGKSWFHDEPFFADYHRLVPQRNMRPADRKYFLRSVLALADGLDGDTAECGVWNGSSSWFICQHFAGSGKVHHGFDSFDGLSMPGAEDGSYWHAGDLRSPEETARAILSGFDVNLYPGWIPERFPEVGSLDFCFVHVDVDLYAPTLASIMFFYPRLVAGGILLFDDYGFDTCPGARKAVDSFFADKSESVVHVPTGQSFVIKH